MEKPLRQKTNFKTIIFLLSLAGLLFNNYQTFAVNGGIIGAGFTSGWNNPSNIQRFTQVGINSGKYTANATGTGNQYFRVINSSNGELQANPRDCSNDQAITIGTSLACTTSCGKAFFINASNTTDNYVFKTDDQNNPGRLIVFRIQGSVQTITSVTQNLSTVYRNQQPIITANLSGNLATGQGLYIRYSLVSDFSSSTISQMSVSGSTGTPLPSRARRSSLCFACAM